MEILGFYPTKIEIHRRRFFSAPRIISIAKMVGKDLENGVSYNIDVDNGQASIEEVTDGESEKGFVQVYKAKEIVILEKVKGVYVNKDSEAAERNLLFWERSLVAYKNIGFHSKNGNREIGRNILLQIAYEKASVVRK